MNRPIKDQVIVITGASSGIGRCAACFLAGQGARVVLTSRRKEALEAIATEIIASGGEAIPVAGDVTSVEDMSRVAKTAVERFGRIDTWINGAGVYIQGRVQDITPDEYRRTMDVDFIGTVIGTRCALKVMLPQKSGVIIQLSSVMAKRGTPYATAYSAAKSAVDGFVSSLRAEIWGSGVKISILYPPTVDTPIYHQARAKLGVLPKPAAPIADPLTAAREIEHLARTGKRYRYFGWARPVATLDLLAPAVADWFSHHVQGFTYSDVPAQEDDNFDTPSRSVPSVARAGWARNGWKGLTAREMIRVLPLEATLLSAAAGFIAARMIR